jgi:anaerobic magnesium-protoporphyrin IX monomethyl ester cyclase
MPTIFMENQKIKKVMLGYPNSPTHYVVPPIGLGYLATSLRKNVFEVYILDGIKEKLNPERLEGRINEWKSDAVGIHDFSCDAHIVKDYVSKIREIDMNILVIVGGVHVSGVRKEGFEYFSGIHFVIAGEGETAFPMLLKKINSGEKSLDEVPGRIYKKENKIFSNAPKFEEELDKQGFPAWDYAFGR